MMDVVLSGIATVRVVPRAPRRVEYQAAGRGTTRRQRYTTVGADHRFYSVNEYRDSLYEQRFAFGPRNRVLPVVCAYA